MTTIWQDLFSTLQILSLTQKLFTLRFLYIFIFFILTIFLLCFHAWLAYLTLKNQAVQSA